MSDTNYLLDDVVLELRETLRMPAHADEVVSLREERDRLRAELDALRKQEPVAWMQPKPKPSPGIPCTSTVRIEGVYCVPLYTAPVPPAAVVMPDERIARAVAIAREFQFTPFATPATVAQKVPDGFRIVPRDIFTRAICALAYAVNTYPDDPCGFLDAYNAMSAVGPVITSDYALVPVELSAKMFEAADNVYSSPRSMWAAMLAAAQAQEGK